MREARKTMITPRTILHRPTTERPAFRFPKADGDFAGWGPKLMTTLK